MCKKGFHHTLETIERMRRAHSTPEAIAIVRRTHLGKHLSAETIEKIRQSNILTHNTPEALEQHGRNHLGMHHTPESKEKNRIAHLGRRLSPEHVEKLRVANTGKRPTHETIEKIRRAHIGMKHSSETKEKMRQLRQDPEYLKNRQKSLHSKTKPEKYVDQLLQALYPNEFKYNGRYDRGICIDRLIPDFVNVNGRKEVVDVHGSYYHEGEDVNERMARYAKYGYSSLIIWEHELKNEKAVIQKIVTFVGKQPNHYFETCTGS